jgi:O-antigen/teichoic acid export membrane protein
LIYNFNTASDLDIKKIYDRFVNSSSYTSLLLALTQSFIAFFFIVIDFFYSKKLSVSDFGNWKQMYFLISLGIPLLSLGIPEGYKYFLAKEGKPKEIFSNTFLFILFITGILLVICLFVNLFHYYGWINIKQYYLISFLFPIAYFSFGISKVLRYAYINEKKVKLFTKINIFFSILTLIIIGIVYFNFQEIKTYYLLVGMLLFICIFELSNTTLLNKLRLTINSKWLNKEFFLNVLGQGFPLYLATFIGTLSVNLDKSIVSFFENKETFAIFSVGALEIPVFAMLSASFSLNVYPQLVTLIHQDKKEQAKKLWIHTTTNVSYITFPMILVLMFFAKDIIYLVYSPKYEKSVFLFQTYLLMGLFRNNSYGALIAASGKTKFITMYSAMMLTFNLILSFILYKILGIEGVIIGSLASTTIIAFLQLKHEGLLKMYFKKFVLNPKIFILILLIMGYYFTRCL